MRKICVFCGSSPGGSPVYVEAANNLGKHLVDSGMELVYGGGNVGLMGEIARAVLAAGGRVTGVIPKKLVEMEVALTEVHELIVVNSMHERKALMAQLSDAFIAMPGGLGTFEETFEVLTWTQLGMHTKPAGFLNVNGYYDHLAQFLDHAVEERFIAPLHRQMIFMDHSPAILLEQLQKFELPIADKAAWVKKLDAERNSL